VQAGPKILIAAFDDASHQYAFRCVSQIRQAGIAADLYPEPGKLKKQFKYATDIGCTYIAIAGEAEVSKGTLMLKNLLTGEQEELTVESIVRHFN
jgi:histidyl-tRNA synthetase